MPYAEGLDNLKDKSSENKSYRIKTNKKVSLKFPKHRRKDLLKFILYIYFAIAGVLFVTGYFQTVIEKKVTKLEISYEGNSDLNNGDYIKDDWVFKQSEVEIAQSNNQYVNVPCNITCKVKGFFNKYSLQEVSIAMVIFLIFFLFMLADTYLLYRFYGFIIRRFKKDKVFGNNQQLKKALIMFLIGLPVLILGLGVISSLRPTDSLINAYSVGFKGISLVLFLYLPFGIIYFIYSFIVWSIRKHRKTLNFSLKGRSLYSFTILSYSFICYFFLLMGITSNVIGTYNSSLSYSSGSTRTNIGALNSRPNMGASPNIAFAPMADMKSGAVPVSENIGFSAGGSKDINNFRENIENGYLPLPTDITYEGLFYDYYFDTGQIEKCNELFCPSYSYANTPDPFSDKYEEYISVGLNSGIKEEDFKRKKLNLVIVMDISGSMGSPFNRYYYDNPSGYDTEKAYDNRSKMQVANENVVSLLSHLNPDDNFGMVLFDDRGYIAKPMLSVGHTDMKSIKEHILDIRPQGGTNMEDGLVLGTTLLDKYKNTDMDDYENRIIFITDAQPNTGITDRNGLLAITKENAENNINTTFIGVGVDFNSELIERITKIRGSNYYSVHSSDEFEKRMDEGFEYMVTPLVFDLSLEIESDNYEIEKVYGSPEADKATGQIMYVNTLFPSDSEGGETKGGIVLIKLKRLPGTTDKNIKLYAKYEDRNGKKHNNEISVDLPNYDSEYFDNNGIRKSILLTRYANLLKNWMIDERLVARKVNSVITEPYVNGEDGIILPDIPMLSEWERTSMELKVDRAYKRYFADFKNYLNKEMQYLNDELLAQEVNVLDLLIEE